MEATQQTDQMLSKGTDTKKFVHEGKEYPDTPYFRNMVARMERREEEGPGTFKEAAQTIAEVSPVIGDAIAMYELPEDMKNAFALIKQGYSEGDIKDMGLGAGYAALTAAGIVPGLGMGARVLRKGLRASLDDAVEQTGNLFRTASGMDDTSGLITVTDKSVKITKPPKSVQKGPTTFKFFGGDKGVSSDQKYTDYASSKKKADQQSFDTDTDKEEFIFRDSKGTYVDPADKKFRYEIGTANLNFSDVIYERAGDLTPDKTVQLSFAQLQNKNRKAAIDAGFDAEDGVVLLPDLFENHEIFDEYPFLRNVQVKRAETDDAGQALYDGAFDPGAGIFSRQAILIDTVNNAENFKSILVHEMQHAIDFFEDRQFGADFNRLLKVEMETRGLADTVDDNTMDGLNKAIRAFNELEKAEKKEIYSIVSKKYSMVAGEVDARNVEFRLRNPNLQFQELPTKFTDEKAPKGKDVDVTKMYEGLDPVKSTSVKTQQAFAEPLEIGVSEFNVKNLDNPNIVKNYTVDDYNEAMRASNAGSTAGSKAKNKKINAPIEEGTDVSVRLNLSSKIDPNGPDAPFNRMQTIHPVNPNTKKPNYSKADSYMNVVTVENGVFDVNQTSRRNIAETGLKVPAASVQGKFNSTRNVLEEGGDDIIEIGMNPQRQHLFTDVSNGQAVRSFDVATIIRDRVYAKGVKYWKKAEAPTPLPAKGDKEIDNQVRYKMKKGGAVPMDRQMDMFDDGGLMDEGGTIDPISGNDVPSGSTQEEVRDDIPAQLSEGEFVFPADVVRYIGLEKLMQMRQEAKMGLAMMERMGQMGNSEEATMSDDIPFELSDLDITDDPVEMQEGGVVPGQGFPSIPPGIPTPQQQVAGISGFQQAQQPTTGVAAQPVQAASAAFAPVRPQQAFVPTFTQQPTPFTTFIGPGVPQVDYEFGTFKNEAGQTIQLKIKKGSKGELIAGEVLPEGYTYVDPEATQTEEVTTIPTTTQTTSVRMEDADSQSRDEARRKEEEEKFGPGGGRIGIAGTIYGVSFDYKNPVLGGLGALAKAFESELKPGDFATLQNPIYKPGKGPGETLQPEIVGSNKFRVNATEYNAIKAAIDEFGANSKQAQNAIANAEDKGQARANALDSVAELKRTLPAFNQSREIKNAIEEYEKYIKQEIDKLDDDTQQSNLVTKSSGRPGKAGSLINPFEAPGGRVSGDRGRPEVQQAPSKPERQDVAQTVRDMGSFDRPDDRGDTDRQRGGGQSFGKGKDPSGDAGSGGYSPFKQGGLASKPKAKKKMKRGGLASKK